MRSPFEFSLGSAATEVPQVLVCTEAIIVGEVFPTYASRPGVPLEMRYPLEFSLGFVAIEVVSLWRCSELLPEVSLEAIVGEISPTYASRSKVSLEMRSPLEFSLGFVAIKVSLWHCTELPPKVSPVLVHAEAIVGEVSPTCPSRPEASFGFVAIEISL